jgi:hypothetical protein
VRRGQVGLGQICSRQSFVSRYRHRFDTIGQASQHLKIRIRPTLVTTFLPNSLLFHLKPKPPPVKTFRYSNFSWEWGQGQNAFTIIFIVKNKLDRVAGTMSLVSRVFVTRLQLYYLL